MASRQVKINVVAVVLAGAAVGLVTNYATAEVPEWFKDQSHVWLTFGLLVLASVVVQLLAAREKPEPAPAEGKAWNVPGRNPNFTGRDKHLKDLRRLLKARSRVAVHAVRGMGGVGKTQLVLEFCHRYCTRLDAVWWIEAENPTLIPDQLRGLGRALGLDLPPDAVDTVQIVLAHLRGLPRWLLVFDNAESVADLHPFLPSDAGKVLITTRRAGFDAIGGLLDLDTMARRESLELLSLRAPNLSASQADELAELLGDLPLGLEQAAAYLAQSQIPPNEYLDLLRTNPDDLSDKGEDGHRRSPDRSLDKLWTLSLQRLDEHHPPAAQLLAICAYLAPEPIPLELFTDAALPAPLGAAAESAASLSHVVGVLTDYSLVKRDRDTITVHRLVQLAARGHTSSAGEHRPLAWAITFFRRYLPGEVYDEPKNWPVWRLLLPHVLAVLQHHTTTSDLVPESASWLLDRTATYLHTTGRAGAARPLLERAVAINETTHGQNHPNIASSLCNLALVLQDLGQLSDAKSLLERSLTINETSHGQNHPDVAVNLSNLAIVLQDLGELANAKPLLERSLTIDETAGGPNHPTVAIRLSGLGMVLKDLGLPADARPLLERALTISETALGPNHPTVAIRLSGLGMVLKDLGLPADARPLLERALTIGETALGPNHPNVAVHLSNLALVLQDLGQPADAKQLLERALTIGEANYGPNHPSIATRLNNLGIALRDLGQAAEAKQLFERAITINEAVYGPNHPKVAIGLRNLGLLLRDLGQSADAEPLLERAKKIRAERQEAVSSHGDESPI